MAASPVGIPIHALPSAQGLPLPQYQTEGAAGLDLLAAVEGQLELKPNGSIAVPCGFEIAVPHGFEAQVRPRSGLALKHGVTVLNSPGTIDSDYRGEVRVILINHGASPFMIRRGDRIAQMVISPVARIEWEAVGVLPATQRGAGGFGHTG